jgi:hypothetical protein
VYACRRREVETQFDTWLRLTTTGGFEDYSLDMRKKWWIAGGIGAAVLVGLVGSFVWIALWVGDNIDAPGPGPTGSGPCGSSDAVNIQLVYADGHAVQACTRDKPACPNQALLAGNGATTSMSRFSMSNQLRSSSRRYILYMHFDRPLPAEASAQTIQLGDFVDLPGQPGVGSAGTGPAVATIQITPRDPYEDPFTTTAGSLSVASTHGVAQGRIDGSFTAGPTRPDRPAPTSTTVPPASITGTFSCSR